MEASSSFAVSDLYNEIDLRAYPGVNVLIGTTIVAALLGGLAGFADSSMNRASARLGTRRAA
jgi:hypothetical protein